MNIGKLLLDLLFPRRCSFCHRLTRKDAAVCPHCREKLPYTRTAAVQSIPHTAGCCSPLYYVEDVRRSLLRYKFGGITMYAEVYGEFMAKAIDDNHIFCDSITWVPLSRRRLRSRGYDQARLLAEDLAERMMLPCVPTLRKRRHTRAQSATGNAEKRRRNIKNAYEAIDAKAIQGKRLLLVDDIVTTGATLSECASVLRKAGAAEIFAVTVARRKD